MGFGQTDVARVTQVKRASSLRNGPFDPGSFLVLLLELIGLLPLPCNPKGFVLGLRFDTEDPWAPSGSGAVGAPRTLTLHSV